MLATEGHGPLVRASTADPANLARAPIAALSAGAHGALSAAGGGGGPLAAALRGPHHRLADRLLEQAVRECAQEAARAALRELADVLVTRRRALGAGAAHGAHAAVPGPSAAAAAASAPAEHLTNGAGGHAARAGAPAHSPPRAPFAGIRAQPPHGALLELVVGALLADEAPLAARAATSELVGGFVARRRALQAYERALLPAALSPRYARVLAAEALAELDAEALLEGALAEACARAARDALAERAAEAAARVVPLRSYTQLPSRPRGPPPAAREPAEPDARLVERLGRSVVLERLLFDALAHKLARAGESLLVRDAASHVSDELLSDLLLRRCLAVAQRREEADPARPLGAARAQLTADLLLEAMIAGLVSLPLDEDEQEMEGALPAVAGRTAAVEPPRRAG